MLKIKKAFTAKRVVTVRQAKPKFV
ncbi:Protein of unknown function [Bacillus mycoides]|nr:Protein of unknown function [Bacillus mycoides]